MLNRSASLAMSTSVLKALPGKLDIKRHLPSILYYFNGYLLFIAAKAASLCSNVSQLLWRSSGFPENRNKIYLVKATQVTCDFQQCGILTCIDSDKPAQPPFKLRDSK